MQTIQKPALPSAPVELELEAGYPQAMRSIVLEALEGRACEAFLPLNVEIMKYRAVFADVIASPPYLKDQT